MMKEQVTGAEKFMLNRDGKWNILCDRQGMQSCKGTDCWDNVTCKNCLKLKTSVIIGSGKSK